MQSRKNYLSRNYQVSVLIRFAHRLKSIEKALNKNEQGAKLYITCHAEIESLKNEILGERDTKENNHKLLEFFKNTKLFLNDEIVKFSPTTFHLSLFRKNHCYYDLVKMIKFCEQQYDYLNNAVEITIYKFRFPRLNILSDASTEFPGFNYKYNYENPIKVALLSSIFLLLLINFEVQPFHILLMLFIAKLLTESLQGSVPNQGYVFSFSNCIPSEWIYGIEGDNYANSNPNFDLSSQYDYWSDFHYVVDCRDPHAIFHEGINFYKRDPFFNPSGHIVFFDNFKTALDFSKLQSNGLSYDNNLGWQLNNKWSNEDRKPLKKALLRHTLLPEPIAEIVDQYFDYKNEGSLRMMARPKKLFI